MQTTTDALLARIEGLASLRDWTDDRIWDYITQAREEGISLRRISEVSGISPTHLARKLDGRAA